VLAAEDVVVVVASYNGLPWLQRCLESVRAYETLVVDVGSTDGSPELVRERFPSVRVLEVENRGYGAALNAGIRASSSRHVLVLNADAWLVGEALDRLVAFADAHPRAAAVGPRTLNPDGSLQRTIRGFPTLWRLATEYLFLRKLAPRSQALNAFYGGGSAHDRTQRVDWLQGACLLVRRAAADEVGLLDEAFFLFSEETDWLYRFRAAGWETWFCAEAEVVHVGAASHGGALYHENLRSHLRFFAKHRGAREAERARLLLLLSLRLRALVFRGARGVAYRRAAGWLASGSVEQLLDEPR
jgi:GT2 family glycosyltransferase